MNRYPLWKNLLVFGVVFVAMILALPNLFGDDEAVHVSRSDGVAVDAGDAHADPQHAMDKAAHVPYSAAAERYRGADPLPTVSDQLRGERRCSRRRCRIMSSR